MNLIFQHSFVRFLYLLKFYSDLQRLEAIAAKEKYRDLVEQGEFKLRVGVRAGGCDGFEYFLDLDKEPVTEDDMYVKYLKSILFFLQSE